MHGQARILALLLVTCLAATPTLAQTEQSKKPEFLAQPSLGSVRASKLIGIAVIGQDHVRVGSIDDVVLDSEGHIEAIVIDVGGFLGIGTKKVAVPFSQMAWNTADGMGKAPDPSIVKPENAPSAEAAATAGPETMPGAKTSDSALSAETTGDTDKAGGTGSAQRADASRGQATVRVGEPVEAEVRFTKAELQAAPTFSFDAKEKH